ncbi:ribonuclease P protein component [Pseudanabaena sp. FACHB-2040]|uniref:ribonuclease P protein component n=1 Tax=Pseudanabaena sp. FACHB-2040 TaxID=2692859 RepID=UPI0016891626|nr:ribonuclease P protein component [Pseudanabaena sp. FACHB-2040]
MALPKQHRLRHSREFSAVYRHGSKAVSEHLVVRVLAQNTAASPGLNEVKADPPKFGISISQKVSKRAVIRNRLKRQVRAAIRQLLPSIRCGLQIVVIVRPDSVECEYGEFLRELEQLLSKLEVIDGHS